MLNFRSIFDRHFFSNHNVHAIKVEEVFEAQFMDCECVTFSSFAALLVSIADEICDASHHLLDTSATTDSQDAIVAANRFLAATSRPTIALLTNEEKEKWSNKSRLCLGDSVGLKIDAILVSESEIVAGVVNLSGVHDMLASAGVFVTKNADMAEKMRWSRSSYGRRASTKTGIAANGRFSEFQAIITHHLLGLEFNGSDE